MKRVLLIEHEGSTRRSMEFALALHGYVTTIATSSQQFLELASRRAHALLIAGQPPAPDESPADLCRAIRAVPELAGTPLLVLEAPDNDEGCAAALRAGANGALIRPVGAAQLGTLLDSLEQPHIALEPDMPPPSAAAVSTALSPEHYRMLVERSSGLTLIVEANGNIVWSNPAAGHLLGRTPDELTGSNVLMLCHPDDTGTLSLLLDTAVAADDAPVVDVRFVRQDDTAVDLELRVESLRQPSTAGGIVLMGHDVSERVERERALRGKALHDALTGLPNRLLFIDQAERTLARAERRNEPVVLVFVDLDDLQEVNQRHGRPAVDALLQAVAARLSGTLRANDTTSRFGDDEFAILLDDIVSARDAATVAERLLAELTRPFEVSAETGLSSIVVTSSIGVAVSRPKEAATQAAGETRLDDLLRRADAALSRAKASGKARWVNADDLGGLTFPLAFPSTE